MIAHLRGKLIHKQPGQAIVEAAGVGYDVTISVPTFTALPAVGAEAAAHPHPGPRRPDRALRLSGAGRKAPLRTADHRHRRWPQAGHHAAQRPQRERAVTPFAPRITPALTRIPGVGKKLAERLVLELKDKLDDFAAAPVPAAVHGAAVEDVLSALTNLGYQRPAAEKAIQHAVEKDAALAGISTASSARP
jgi:Holliday junction DNA helicase RuvA